MLRPEGRIWYDPEEDMIPQEKKNEFANQEWKLIKLYISQFPFLLRLNCV